VRRTTCEHERLALNVNKGDGRCAIILGRWKMDLELGSYLSEGGLFCALGLVALGDVWRGNIGSRSRVIVSL